MQTLETHVAWSFAKFYFLHSTSFSFCYYSLNITHNISLPCCQQCFTYLVTSLYMFYISVLDMYLYLTWEWLYRANITVLQLCVLLLIGIKNASCDWFCVYVFIYVMYYLLFQLIWSILGPLKCWIYCVYCYLHILQFHVLLRVCLRVWIVGGFVIP